MAERVVFCVKVLFYVNKGFLFTFSFSRKVYTFAKLYLFKKNYFKMKKQFALIVGLILVAASFRLIDHLPNFTPVGAIALFAGAYITNRILAFLVPVAALLLSDLYLGFYGWEMLVPYIGFILTILMGFSLQNNKGAIRIGLTSMASSVVFFLFTNFALFYPETLYPHTFSGIMQSYVAGIPFFQNALAADLFYNAALFGSFYLITINIPSFRKAA